MRGSSRGAASRGCLGGQVTVELISCLGANSSSWASARGAERERVDIIIVYYFFPLCLGHADRAPGTSSSLNLILLVDGNIPLQNHVFVYPTPVLVL